MKNRIFDLSKDINMKNKKVQEIVLYVLSFIFIPIFNALMSITSDESPVYTSFSRIAWVHDMFYIMIIVILVNAAILMYSIYHILQTGQYSKKAKIFVYSLFGFAILVAVIGSCIPAYYLPDDAYYTSLRTAHAVLVGLGLCLLFIALAFIAYTSFYRNKNQGIIEMLMCITMLIVAAYSILVVNDKDSYCTTSAVSQILILSMLIISSTLFSIFNTTFKTETNKNDAELNWSLSSGQNKK